MWFVISINKPPRYPSLLLLLLIFSIDSPLLFPCLVFVFSPF